MKKGFMPPEDYELRHGRTTLDVTLSIRFANLVKNAKLELVKSEKTRAESAVVIALQLADGARLQHGFSPAASLWDLLQHWENQPNSEHKGKLAATYGDEYPVCIYMRDEVIGEEALKATTLRKLGLTGGKAIVRLLHRCVPLETLEEISRQLAVERAKREQMVARSSSIEAMSTETSGAANVAGGSMRGLPSESQPGQFTSSACERITESPMETESDSVSPARKQPKLEPVSESMDHEMQHATSSTRHVGAESSSQSVQCQSNKYLDELESIPGVQVFRPGEPVKLSAEQQKLVRSLAHEIEPHIIQPTRPQNGQSSMSTRPKQQQPAPFKFPKAMNTNSQDLISDKEREANKEDYSPCDRETVVYNLDEIVQHGPEYNSELPDDFFVVTVDDVKRMMVDRVRELEALDDQPLMTKAMRQAVIDDRFLKYKKVVIRVQFPDKMVLQGLFRPKETVYAVEKFVKEHLEDKGMPLYLYTAPPKCVLKDRSCTLIEAKLAPASVIYFGTDSKKGGSYLSTAVLKESSSRLEADKLLLKCMPTESSADKPGTNSSTSSKKGGQPKRSNPGPVDYPSRDKASGKDGGEKKMPSWFAAGVKK